MTPSGFELAMSIK